jgi:hypothetical protein
MYGSLCGAINGCSAAISAFVPDVKDKFALIQDLCVYNEETTLPIYVPKEDKHPDMTTYKAKSVLCHVSLANWMTAGDTTLEKPVWVERCIRLTSDLVTRTVELLNAYHADHPKTLAGILSLTAETQSCMECHTHDKERYDSLAKMNCTTCHSDIDAGSECPRGMQPVK